MPASKTDSRQDRLYFYQTALTRQQVLKVNRTLETEDFCAAWKLVIITLQLVLWNIQPEHLGSQVAFPALMYGLFHWLFDSVDSAEWDVPESFSLFGVSSCLHQTRFSEILRGSAWTAETFLLWTMDGASRYSPMYRQNSVGAKFQGTPNSMPLSTPQQRRGINIWSRRTVWEGMETHGDSDWDLCAPKPGLWATQGSYTAGRVPLFGLLPHY